MRLGQVHHFTSTVAMNSRKNNAGGGGVARQSSYRQAVTDGTRKTGTLEAYKPSQTVNTVQEQTSVRQQPGRVPTLIEPSTGRG